MKSVRHGRSSNFPPHLPLDTLNFLLVYRILSKHFNEKSFTILGIHSYPIAAEDYVIHLLNIFQHHFSLHEKLLEGKQPKYKYKEAFDKVKYKRDNGISLNDEGTEALLKRGLRKVGEDEYVFTIDQRMKYYVDPIHDFNFAIRNLKKHPLQCPTLMIVAKGNKHTTKWFKPVLDELKKQDNFKMFEVPGYHDVHNTHPERVAPFIREFMDSKGKVELLLRYYINILGQIILPYTLLLIMGYTL
nr:unnamed protein product [Callosobruchus chinensis]